MLHHSDYILCSNLQSRFSGKYRQLLTTVWSRSASFLGDMCPGFTFRSFTYLQVVSW